MQPSAPGLGTQEIWRAQARFELFSNPPLLGYREPPSRDAIEGRVVDLSDAPQRGVPVRLWQRGAHEGDHFAGFALPEIEELARTVTDVDGGFRFTQVRGKLCGLTAEAVSAMEQRFPIVPGSFVEIRLGSGNRIEGRVICNGHGPEVLEGTAVLALDGGEEPWTHVPIAPDGTFLINSVPQGVYELSADVKEHACGHIPSISFEGWKQQQQVELPAEPGVVITGKVVHAASGEPIAGAEVRSMFSNIASVLTDAAGGFRMDTIPSWLAEREASELYATSAGCVQGTARLTPSESIVFRLEPEADLSLVVTGHLLRADGQPIVGAQVSAAIQPYLNGQSDRQPLFRSARTAANGHFALSWREDEDFRLSLRDLAGGIYWLFLGDLSASRDLGEVRLPELQQYYFQVQDENGNAVFGAQVGAYQAITLPAERSSVPHYRLGPVPMTGSEGVRTDSFGRCSLQCAEMEEGGIEVRLGFGGSWSFPLPAIPGQEKLLVLKNLRRVSGRVRYANGDSVPFGWLNVHDREEDAAGPLAESRDPFSIGFTHSLAIDGSFLIQGCYSASLAGSLIFGGEGLRGRMLLPEIRLDQGPIEILVSELTPIVGFVQDAAGQPVAGAVLHLIGDHDLDWWAAETEQDGSFSLKVLLEPNLRLVATEGNRRSVEQAVAAASSLLFLLPAAE